MKVLADDEEGDMARDNDLLISQVVDTPVRCCWEVLAVEKDREFDDDVDAKAAAL